MTLHPGSHLKGMVLVIGILVILIRDAGPVLMKELAQNVIQDSILILILNNAYLLVSYNLMV